MNWTNLFNIILNQSGLKWNEKRIRVNLFISEAEFDRSFVRKKLTFLAKIKIKIFLVKFLLIKIKFKIKKS